MLYIQLHSLCMSHMCGAQILTHSARIYFLGNVFRKSSKLRRTSNCKTTLLILRNHTMIWLMPKNNKQIFQVAETKQQLVCHNNC